MDRVKKVANMCEEIGDFFTGKWKLLRKKQKQKKY